MTQTNSPPSSVRKLHPGCFASVMATGIVSIDANQHGMPMLAHALFSVNVAAFALLVLLTALRLIRARQELLDDFTNPARGAAFLTFAAASCVLASQCLLVVRWPGWATALTVVGAVSWASLLYLLLLAVITGQRKPDFRRSINGGWLVAVVATQSLAVALTLLVAHGGATPALGWLFAALCLYLVGAALYLILITLIFYRLLFLPLAASGFTPPYWINMGALAITTLAGGLLVMHVPAQLPLGDLVPFVKGFTLFFWATATWWIPLLAILELWRHGLRHVRLRYEVDDWDIVFPLGMYTVGTHALAQALDLDLLRPVSDIGVYISLLAWLLVAAGAVRHWRRAFIRT
ncbi:MAG TPA: tellurite resistance/C4-dicarboxylate transporter family protein [Rhodanobacter sp.]|nr:tellurite resistance/C4-dicarboxylate transporter family protein [Rhodanobacter sp.]